MPTCQRASPAAAMISMLRCPHHCRKRAERYTPSASQRKRRGGPKNSIQGAKYEMSGSSSRLPMV
eukprot:5478720-Alexandrium_andersonii.AAC.1